MKKVIALLLFPSLAFGNAAVMENISTTKSNCTIYSTGTISGCDLTGSTGTWTRSGSNLYPSHIGDSVGIGTTSPSDTNAYGGKTLDVSGPIYARQSNDVTKYISIGASAGTAYFETGGTNLSFTNIGNVGIGTANPSTQLNVYNSGNNVYLSSWTANGKALTIFEGTNGSVGQHIGTMDNNGIGFFTNGQADQMYLKSGGNMGIGTTSPSDTNGYGGNTIDVSGPVYARQSNDATKYVSIGASAGTAFLETGGINLDFTNIGNVGIGTAIPGATLTVNGTTQLNTTATTHQLYSCTNGTYSGMVFRDTTSGACTAQGGTYGALGIYVP